MLSTITAAINNALRLYGKDVPDKLYRTEDSFMPAGQSEPAKPASKPWSSVATTLGFKT